MIDINIAILMAAYNGEKWLTSQIVSIFKMNTKNIQLHISVDESTDKTYSICESSVYTYVNVNLLQSAHFGNSSKNFFRLIRDVNLDEYNYISLADQDDIWDAGKLESAIKMLSETGGDAYSSNVIAFWENGKTKLIDKAQTQRHFDYMFESAGPGCTFVLTQKLALHLQKFLIQNQQSCADVSMHDWFIYAFARTNGYKWVIDKHSYMQYRQHENNVMGANAGWQAKLTRWKKLRAGWLTTQAILLADIIGYSDSWVIKRLKRNNLIDKIVLIINVSKFRRKFIDSLALAASFLVGIKK